MDWDIDTQAAHGHQKGAGGNTHCWGSSLSIQIILFPMNKVQEGS